MKSTWTLFTVRGIEIKLHFTFPLILLWFGLQFGALSGSAAGFAFGAAVILLLFTLVTLHELGHSFAAQHYGVNVKQIMLTPLGGIAQLARFPDKPVQELVIAAAGPAVNVVVAAIMAVVGWAAGIPLFTSLGDLTGGSLGPSALFSTIFLYNIMLAVFNLMPAFPLDGGRIFRALLAMRLDYVRATRIAATAGRILAVGLGLYGLFAGGLFTILIALFIYTAAGAEAREAEVRGALRGHTVQHAYSPSVYRLAPNTTLQQAANLMLYGGQRNFPVVDGERLVGFIAHADLVAALRTSPPYTTIDRIMRTDIDPLEPSLDLYEAQHRLREQQVEALPVAGRGRFLGLIGLGQIEQYLRLLKAAPNVITQSQSA